MKVKSVFSIGTIIASSVIFGLVSARQSQAVTLANFNGTFTGATVSGSGGSSSGPNGGPYTNGGYTNGAVTTSAYLGDSNVTLPDWYFSTNAQNPGNGQKGFNFLVAYGAQVHNNLAAQDKCSAPFSTAGTAPNYTDCYGTGGLQGTATLLNPLTGNTSGFFIAADAFFNHGAINTDITGLTAGSIYTVSFYQATGQQYGQTAAFTDYFDVSFGGGATQKSTTMSYAGSGAAITPWTLQSLDFTASGPNQTLSFLAQSPNDVPPFALLSNVTVTKKLPEPEAYLGTLIWGGFLATVMRSRLKKKKAGEQD